MINLALIMALVTPTTITRDTLIQADTATVITTVCAPICSSIVRVYAINNKEWDHVRTLIGDTTMVFPQAYFEQQQLKWRDNTPEMLDEEGK